MTLPIRRLLAADRAHLPIVLAVCGLVYWPFLGWAGFAATEGHRVIPGWTMRESGNWWRLEMFHAAYLRKPPGMPWAVGSLATIFGESEFAARAVSALSMTLFSVLALVFARRWFGRAWGLAAGVTAPLMPWLWVSGRSAEIECLNLLMTQASALLVVDLLLARRERMAIVRWGLLAAALCGTVLAKGPAGLPVPAAAAVACCLAMRSVRPLGRPGLWVSVALAAGASVLLLRPFFAAGGEPDAVGEQIDKFLWNPSKLPQILTLIPAGFVAAAPASLGLLFAWRRPRGTEVTPARMAFALFAAWLLAMIGYNLTGISNVRYVMPAAALLPPLAAFAWRSWRDAMPTGDSPTPPPRRRQRIAFLGHPLAWPVLLLAFAGGWIPMFESNRAMQSGREAGRKLAAAIPNGSEVWADSLVEARPELIQYALIESRRAGHGFVPRWKKQPILKGQLPQPGAYLLLRTDHDRAEARLFYGKAIDDGRLEPVYTDRFYPDLARTRFKVTFTLFRVREVSRLTLADPD